VLQRVAVCCSVLLISLLMLLLHTRTCHVTHVCCSVLQCDAAGAHENKSSHICKRVMSHVCVALYCSVLLLLHTSLSHVAYINESCQTI